MALIEMQADLKRTNELLMRIAMALERILLEQYGVTYGHCAQPAPDPTPNEQSSVEYEDDDKSARRELIAAARELGLHVNGEED